MQGWSFGFKSAAIATVLAAFLCACADDGAEEKAKPSPSLTASPAVSPVAVPEASPPVVSLFNADAAKSTLTAKLTQDEATELLGADFTSEASSFYLNEDWVPTRVWTYLDKASSARLQLYWSEEGMLLYAVLYDRDPQGNERSYVPSIGALTASSSDDNPLAAENGIRIGQTSSVKTGTAGYDMIGSREPRLSYFAVPERPLMIRSLTDTLAEIDDDGIRSWVPIWYLTNEAENLEEIAPFKASVTPGTPLYWYPNAGREAVTVTEDETAYALRAFGEWYGVALPDSASRQGYGLLWVHKDRIKASETDWKPVYEDPGATPEAIAAIDRAELRIGGLSGASAEKIFGRPQSVEASANIERPGKLKTLPVWRYENADTQLTLTWSDADRLLNYRFRDGSGKYDIGNEDPYTTEQPIIMKTTDAVRSPLARTASVDYDWRIETELPFNFLIGEAGRTLLIAGEDGGISGFHEASHLYGVDKTNGRKLWKYDFGYGLHLFALSPERQTIVFYRPLDNSNGKSSYRLLAMNTRDGKTRWERTVEIDDETWEQTYEASDSVAVLAVVVGDEEKRTTRLEARDIRSGKVVWSTRLEGVGRLLPNPDQSPVVIVQTEGPAPTDTKLMAFDARSGKAKWELKGRSSDLTSDGILATGGPSDSRKPAGFWSRDEEKKLILGDRLTGAEKLILPVTFEYGTHYDGIDDRYMFKQQSEDGERLYDSKNVTSSLIDLQTGETVWTVAGKADNGAIADGILYFCLDLKPRAVELADGKTVWEADFEAWGNLHLFGDRLLVEGIPDVYALNLKTGRVESRFHDVRIGYYEYIVDGMLAVRDGDLYIGSSNGYFGKVSAK